MRALAVDYGSARAGLAVSDPSGTLATPAGIVERPGTRRGLGRVVEAAVERAVDRVVVGLPVGLTGADTAQTAEARAFADRLARALARHRIAVELYDERFTTRMAQRIGGEGEEDARAAAHLLEGWLAAQHSADR